MLKMKSFINDTSGEALVVEAAILLPIIMMVFAALVVVSIYLPQRTILQESVQVAATAIAIEQADSWVGFDNNARYQKKNSPLPNVYLTAIRSAFLNSSTGEDKARAIVMNLANRGFISTSGTITVEYDVVNYIIYQEVIVTATQKISTQQFGLSFIGFPGEITLTQEARAVIQNGDEFVRNVNIAKDLFKWIDDKFGISETLKSALDKIGSVGSIFGF